MQIKADHATNDAIVDDTAGQAYVEQFAVETFQRADRAVQANKVTKYGTLCFLNEAKLIHSPQTNSRHFPSRSDLLRACQYMGTTRCRGTS
jgi:hypothetical protein